MRKSNSRLMAFLPNRSNLLIWQILLPFLCILVWYGLTESEILPSFFFGHPFSVFGRIVDWFVGGTIYPHLGVTLLETALSFVLGTTAGGALGLWLGLRPIASQILSPYVKAANVMPRIILAPIFALWFGLGIWSKVTLSMSLVMFVVFFSVYQGIREVSPVLLANARILGASSSQLVRKVFVPSAMSWVFSSLHTSVGLAFVGCVVGEYLGSARGVGYLILQADSTFDVDTVFAGIIVLTACALCLDVLVGIAERRLLSWQPLERTTTQI